MVSEEFKRNVESKDVVTVRSALVDYLIIDTTFRKFDEALDYAEKNLGVIEPPQAGETSDFEKNSEIWNESYLNKQKVALMVYFSQARINHLKDVITKVLGAEASKPKTISSDANKDVEASIKSNGIRTGKTGRTVLSERELHHSAEDRRSNEAKEKADQTASTSHNTVRTSTTSNNRTGRRTVGVTEGKTKRTEEEVHPVDIAAWMIGGGIAIAAVGGVTAGVGVAIAKPTVVHAGIATACVGGGVAIIGGVVKIIKNM